MAAESPPHYVPAIRIGSYSGSYVGTPPLYFNAEHHQENRRPRHIQHDYHVTGQDELSSDHHDNHAESTNHESSSKKLSRRQILTLVILCAGNVSSAMFGSLLAPFFPTEAQKKGASLYEVGIIFGSFPLIQFIASPIFGSYMTTLGSKYLFVAGNFVCSGCAILFGILEWCPNGVPYVVMCFVCRSVESVGSAAQNIATFTIGAYTFPGHLSLIMGLLQASSCIGLVAGPPIGGLLYSKGGFFLPFAVTGSLFMFFSFASFIFLPSPKDDNQRPSGSLRSMLKLLSIPLVLVVGYLVLVGQLTIGFIDVALSTYLSFIQPDISTIYVGLIFLIPAGLVVLLAPIVGLITDKYQKMGRPFMVIGAFIGAAGFMGIGPSPLLTFLPQPSTTLVIISLVVSAVGWGCLVVAYQQYLTAAKDNGFPDSLETQGIISGINGAFSSFGAFLGPTVGGILYENLKFPWASTIVASTVFLSGIILIVYMVVEAICRCGRNEIPSLSSGERGYVDGEDEPLLTA